MLSNSNFESAEPQTVTFWSKIGILIGIWLVLASGFSLTRFLNEFNFIVTKTTSVILPRVHIFYAQSSMISVIRIKIDR